MWCMVSYSYTLLCKIYILRQKYFDITESISAYTLCSLQKPQVPSTSRLACWASARRAARRGSRSCRQLSSTWASRLPKLAVSRLTKPMFGRCGETLDPKCGKWQASPYSRSTQASSSGDLTSKSTGSEFLHSLYNT